MADAATIINTIAADMKEQKLITIERTLVRSLMLRMRPFSGYPDFAAMFRNQQHAGSMYRLLQAYSRAYVAAAPEMRAELDVRVKDALNGVITA